MVYFQEPEELKSQFVHLVFFLGQGVLNGDDEQDTKREDEQPPLYNPKFNHHLNLDPIYISLQILKELQQINEYLKKEKERKEHKKLTKEIISEVIKQNKDKEDDDEDREIVYYQPTMRRRINKVFADLCY